ncbi:hypothetical protein DB30_06363 [Enhygromyxa salina]|uniref:Cupin domain protein n=1 Tax=Enhygromyxa salina TaxID=215803 RepID=A0A0C2D3U5_9BACT|nr:hypothetical protein [Enhygromyxa salina]KIG14777.1 hypothetical protein DB30_06363 [Enhygromyxa salina]
MSQVDPEVDPQDEDDMDADADAKQAEDEEEEADDQEQDDYGEPFDARSFGGEFVWAKAKGYTCKILRVRAGEKVLVSTRGRQDMVVMLTGGRAVLEVLDGDETDRVEIMPAAPVRIHPEREHRLVAMTEVEIFTVYSQIVP